MFAIFKRPLDVDLAPGVNNRDVAAGSGRDEGSSA